MQRVDGRLVLSVTDLTKQSHARMSQPLIAPHSTLRLRNLALPTRMMRST